MFKFKTLLITALSLVGLAAVGYGVMKWIDANN